MSDINTQWDKLLAEEKEAESKYRKLFDDKYRLELNIREREGRINQGIDDDDVPLLKNLYQKAVNELPILKAQLAQNLQDQVTFKQQYNDAREATRAFTKQNDQAIKEEGRKSLEQKLADQAADPKSTVKNPSATNSDTTAAESDRRMRDAETVGKVDEPSSTGSGAYKDEFKGVDEAVQKNREADLEFERESRRRPVGVPDGAEKPQVKSAEVNVYDAKGSLKNRDLRVKIRVPTAYLKATTIGLSRELEQLGGIIFPYTPTIAIEHKANYTSSTPIHNNYTIWFYKNSETPPINITGTFTVQNEKDAGVFLATVHLLRSLTKMRFGGKNGDTNSGSPPPVCRLDAYGDYMFRNVPVVISSFRIDLPKDVDYFVLGKGPSGNSVYGIASVPTRCEIQLTCIPIYSKAEMQKFTVTKYLTDREFKKQGYL